MTKFFSDFFEKKIWTVGEFWTMFSIVVFNPILIVVIEYLLGIQFLIGLMVGWISLCAIQTKWRKDD